MLTKALGTGVIGQAIKKGIASEAATAAAIASMTTLNQGAARIGHAHGVTAATDVTGFGLLGHLRNIVRGSERRRARSSSRALPLLPDALEHLRAKLCPAGSKANRAYVAATRALGRWRAARGRAGRRRRERELLASLACDAQTSGGLLLCVPAERAAACVDELRAAGLPAARIGELREAPASSARNGTLARLARGTARGRRPRCCGRRDRARTRRSSPGDSARARRAAPLSVPPAAIAAS